jgi:ribosomal protein S27E
MQPVQQQEVTATSTQAKVHRYRCPGCGADLVYEPVNGALECPYCGRREELPKADTQVEERSYEQYLQLRRDGLQQIAAGALETQCQSCGATVTFVPPQVAGECDFCGAQIVAQPKAANPMVAPEAVLPFAFPQQQATGYVRSWLGSLWFAPNALQQFASHHPANGVYLPYWTYDTHTVSNYTGARGEFYYVDEQYVTRDAQGREVMATRRVQHTRWYPAQGQVSRWFDDVTVPATKTVSQERLNKLNPWDLNQLRPYEPAYLSGFKAQRYQIEFPDGFEIAKHLIAPVIQSDAMRDIGGDTQRIDSIQTHYSGVTFKHVLLPVYIGAYRFNNKIYQIVVNGRTGEVQGDRPYSWVKIALFVIFLIFVVLIISGGAALFGGN